MISAALSDRIEGTANPSYRSLRIALLSYLLPVEGGAKRGGIERVAHDLAQGLAERGHDVTVWSFDPAPSGARYGVRPLPWRSFATSWLGHRLTIGYLGNVLALRPGYAETDVIVAMGDSLLLPLARKPVVRVMHGTALGEALSATSPWRFVMQMGVYLQELLTPLVQSATVAVSENTRRHNPFIRRVIPNGVDLRRFSADGAEKTPEPSILFVGTLNGRKRGGLLVEWFTNAVRPRHPSARLVVVGPEGAPVDGVEYRTGISGEELARLYRSAWVYASPSRYEGFGLPYVEAMASGTAVMASPNPGSREVLGDGRFGVLASDAEFPDVLSRLLADATWRRELEEKGLERAQQYSLGRMIDAYETLLREVCCTPGPSTV